MIRPNRGEATICVVLPLLNEAAILRSLANDIQTELQKSGCRWNIVFVNDGSTDDSGLILDEMSAADGRILTIHLSRNFGHQAAVQAGLKHAKGDAIILMDSDGQDNPGAIGPMVESWLEGNDVVYAVRYGRKENFLKRVLFSAFYRILGAIASVPMPRDAGNFGLIDRQVAEIITSLPESDRFFPGLRSWVGFRQKALRVERLDRHDRKPRVRFRGLVSLAKTAFFSFSRAPLTAFYWLAVLSAIVSVGTISFAYYHKLVTGLAIPGWASITSVCAFFGAINALGIAMLGEYIARIYDQVRSRPSYVIARTTEQATKQCTEEETLQMAIREIAALRSELDKARDSKQKPKRIVPKTKPS
jgi:polyisoprenyl-phosphate glycosyltransferase